MRKVLFLAIAALLIMVLPGCLKDKIKDFPTGIEVADIPGVALTQSPSSPVVSGITGQAAPVQVNGPLITLETSGVAPTDVHVTLAIDQNLVTAAGLEPVPAGTFSLNTLDVVIPKGSKKVEDLKLTVNNSDVLDPNLLYGVGIKIVSVDQGFQVASNFGTVVLGLAIKNKYDGIYHLTGYHNRAPYTYPYDQEMHLVTVGPKSVIFYFPAVDDYGHPIGVGPDPVNDWSWYGTAIQPVIVFDPATDLVTDVYNNSSAAVITMFTGAGSRLSKYDPATKAITVDWNYSGNPLRAFFDDMTYVGPRP